MPDCNWYTLILSYVKKKTKTKLVYFIRYYEIKIVTIRHYSNEKFIDCPT